MPRTDRPGGARRPRALTLTLATTAAAALVPAAAAQAATVSGAVIARDAHRGTVVVAAGGHAKTLRVARAGRMTIGRKLRASTVRLADGTYRASHARLGGRVRHVKVTATVVHRTARGFLVSAGSSTFAVRSKRTLSARAAAAGDAPQPGDVVVIDGDARDGALEAGDIQTAGATSTMELEGLVVPSDPGTLKLAVEHQGVVTITVPDGTTLSAAPGDEVEVLVSIGADGSFTLVAAHGDDNGDRGDGGGFDVNDESGKVEVHGVLTALAPDSVTVQAGPDASVTCAVPAGADVSGFALQDRVELSCDATPAGLVVHEMQSEHAHLEVSSGDGEHGDGGGDAAASDASATPDAPQSGGDQASGGQDD